MTKRIHIPVDEVQPIGHYVYAIKVDGVIRYIGKGSKWRAWDHTRGRTLTKVKDAFHNGAKVAAVILIQGLTHRGALRHENRFLVKYRDSIWNVIKSSRREQMLARWADPVYHQRVKQAIIDGNTPEVKERRTQSVREAYRKGGVARKHVSKASKEAYRKSEAMRIGLEAGRTPNARKKQGQSNSANHRLRVRDPQYREWLSAVRRESARKAWITKRRKARKEVVPMLYSWGSRSGGGKAHYRSDSQKVA